MTRSSPRGHGNHRDVCAPARQAQSTDQKTRNGLWKGALVLLGLRRTPNSSDGSPNTNHRTWVKCRNSYVRIRAGRAARAQTRSTMMPPLTPDATGPRDSATRPANMPELWAAAGKDRIHRHHPSTQSICHTELIDGSSYNGAERITRPVIARNNTDIQNTVERENRIVPTPKTTSPRMTHNPGLRTCPITLSATATTREPVALAA